ncbi:MAG: hypothetical protein QG646_2463 [Euryarchaeota archaeon]|nr:hypothetical protein [Euryarchaeota archaeon]
MMKLPAVYSEFNIENYILLKSKPIFESCPARSKAPDSESGLVGVRAFELDLPHPNFSLFCN